MLVPPRGGGAPQHRGEAAPGTGLPAAAPRSPIGRSRGRRKENVRARAQRPARPAPSGRLPTTPSADAICFLSPGTPGLSRKRGATGRGRPERQPRESLPGGQAPVTSSHAVWPRVVEPGCVGRGVGTLRVRKATGRGAVAGFAPTRGRSAAAPEGRGADAAGSPSQCRGCRWQELPGCAVSTGLWASALAGRTCQPQTLGDTPAWPFRQRGAGRTFLLGSPVPGPRGTLASAACPLGVVQAGRKDGRKPLHQAWDGGLVGGTEWVLGCVPLPAARPRLYSNRSLFPAGQRWSPGTEGTDALPDWDGPRGGAEPARAPGGAGGPGAGHGCRVGPVGSGTGPSAQTREATLPGASLLRP